MDTSAVEDSRDLRGFVGRRIFDNQTIIKSGDRVSDERGLSGEEQGLSGFEAIFALVGLVERSFHRHTDEQLDVLLHPDLVVHAPVPMEQGAEAFKRALASTREAFPDMEIQIEASAVQEGLVFRRWSMTGTHQGVFLGIPATGRKVALSGVDIERLDKGRIVEHWTYWDRMSLADQLGLAPSPGL
jgi:steroid delta-isomerase-like uncharacterized protein